MVQALCKPAVGMLARTIAALELHLRYRWDKISSFRPDLQLLHYVGIGILGNLVTYLEKTTAHRLTSITL